MQPPKMGKSHKRMCERSKKKMPKMKKIYVKNDG